MLDPRHVLPGTGRFALGSVGVGGKREFWRQEGGISGREGRIGDRSDLGGGGIGGTVS